MKFIIDFKNHILEDTIQQYLTSIQGTVIKTFGFFEKTYLIECDNTPLFDASLHSHIINDDTSPVQLLSTTVVSNQKWGTRTLDGETISVSTTNINDWWKNYVLYKPDFDSPEYQIDRRGTGVTIYVLDSGCEITHPEFLNRPVHNLFSFNNNFDDTNGHGTAITSVITGVTCGITNATVKSVKIFQDGVDTKQSDLINALDAIYVDFSQNNLSFAVINCSWTISKNIFVETKLKALSDLGIIIIAASGNNGTPIENVTPASMESAITIGSYNQNLTPSDFSNYTGSITSVSSGTNNYGQLDGWAPGEQIYSAGLNGTYGFTAGTSIAAGIHSAVCAYNLELFSFEYIQNMSLTEFVTQHSLVRKNLLDLSNPIYENSTNVISTAYDQIPTDEKWSPTKFSMSVRGVSGEHYYLRVFMPRLTTKLEILGSLPAGTRITDIGIFIGPVPDVTSVTSQLIPMILTDINNNSYEFDFEIITIPKTFVLGIDTTNDPVLDLKLQAFPCLSNPCEDPEGCNDNCNPGTFCNIITDKFCTYQTRCVCI